MSQATNTLGGTQETAENLDTAAFEAVFSAPDDEADGIAFQIMDEQLQHAMATKEGALVVDQFWGPMCSAVVDAIRGRGVQKGNAEEAEQEVAAFLAASDNVREVVAATVAVLQARRNSTIQFVPDESALSAADAHGVDADLNAVTGTIAAKLGIDSAFSRLMTRINRAIHYVYRICPRVAHERARLDALLQRPEMQGDQQ